MGMDLLSPETPEVNQQVFALLKNEGYNSSIAVGGSRIGAESFYYSLKTGEEIDLRVENDEGMCLQLVINSGDYNFEGVGCEFPTDEFLCESSE